MQFQPIQLWQDWPRVSLQDTKLTEYLSELLRLHESRPVAHELTALPRPLGSHSARILMVTQDDERNAFDQRPLEYELLNT